MRFTAGQPKIGGRKSGSQNKTTLVIKDLAQGLVQDRRYLASLARRMESGKSPQLEILMHYYAYGKPKQEISHDSKITVIVQRDRPQPQVAGPVLDVPTTIPKEEGDPLLLDEGDPLS